MKIDTDKKTGDIFFTMMMKKTPQEKALMGFSMFESVKRIVLSSIKKDANTRIELFLRFYGNDFDDTEKQKIILKLEKIR